MVKRIQHMVWGLLVICIVYEAFVLHGTYEIFKLGGGRTPDAGVPHLFAVIPDGRSVDSGAITRELEAAGSKYRAFVEIYEALTAGEQRRILQIAADSGADGILLYPTEKDGYTEVLETCQKAGIPVVVISQRLNNASFSTYIGSGINSERMAVLSCVSATEGDGRILLIDHRSAGERSYTETAVLAPGSREDEAEPPPEIPELATQIADLVRDPFEGYRVERVSVMEMPSVSSYSLYTEVYKLLSTERPDAVFSYDGEVTNVIAACLTNSLSINNMYAVGYGDPRDCEKQLRDGTLDGLVVQDDPFAASLAVRYLVELSRGSAMPANVDSGIVLISEDNMERVLGENEM